LAESDEQVLRRGLPAHQPSEDQPFIRDQTIAIKDMIATKVGKLGENISVRRFARFKVGDTNWTVAQTKISAEE
jgi:elongation factor Ts